MRPKEFATQSTMIRYFKATMRNTVLYAADAITLGTHEAEQLEKRNNVLCAAEAIKHEDNWRSNKEKYLGRYYDQKDEVKYGSDYQRTYCNDT